MRRMGAVALLLAMVALFAFPAPAMAQADPEDCGDFTALCEGLVEVGDGIAPITDGLDAVTDPAAEQLAPLLDALEGGLAQLREAVRQALDQIPCDEVQPIIDQLQGVIDDVQGVLDVATAELVEAAEGLEGILAEANRLIDAVLDSCVADAGEQTEVPDPDDDGDGDVADDVAEDADDEDAGPTLPMTGGGAAVGGALLLGAAGLLATRVRRRV